MTIVALDRVDGGYDNTTFRVTLHRPPEENESTKFTRDNLNRVSKLSGWPMFKLERAMMRYLRLEAGLLQVPDIYFVADELVGVMVCLISSLDCRGSRFQPAGSGGSRLANINSKATPTNRSRQAIAHLKTRIVPRPWMKRSSSAPSSTSGVHRHRILEVRLILN